MYGRGGPDYGGRGRDNFSRSGSNNWDRPLSSGPSSLSSNHSISSNNNAPPPGTRPPPALDAEKTVVKFKTKVCIFWLQPKGCPYGDRCLYAHGAVELRDDMVGGAPGADPDANPRFKTRLCKWWASSGGTHCPHGVRCTYAHGRDELDRFLRSSEESNFLRNLEDNNAELERKKAGAEFWNRNVKKDDESSTSSISNPSFFNQAMGENDSSSGHGSTKSVDESNGNDDVNDGRSDKIDDRSPSTDNYTNDRVSPDVTNIEPSSSSSSSSSSIDNSGKELVTPENITTNETGETTGKPATDAEDKKVDTEGNGTTDGTESKDSKDTIVSLPVETAKALGLPSHLLDSRSLALGPLRPGPAAFRDTAALNAGIPPPPRTIAEDDRRSVPTVTTATLTPVPTTAATGSSPTAATEETRGDSDTGTNSRDAYDRYRSPTTGEIDIRRMPPGILAQYLNERFTKAKVAAIKAGMDPAMAARAAFQIQDFVLGSNRKSTTPSASDKTGVRRDASSRLAALSGDPSVLLNELGSVSPDENYQAALNVIIRALQSKESNRPSSSRPTGNLSPGNVRSSGNTPPHRSGYDDPYRPDNRGNGRYPPYGSGHGYPDNGGGARYPRDPRDSHNNRDPRWSGNRYPDEPPYDTNRRPFNDMPPYGGSHYDYPPSDYPPSRDYRGPPMDPRDYRGGNPSMPPGGNGYNSGPPKESLGNDRDYRDYRDDNRERGDWGRPPAPSYQPSSHWANGPGSSSGGGGSGRNNYDYPNRDNGNYNRDWERDRRGPDPDWPRNPMDRRGPPPSNSSYNNGPAYNSRGPNDWPRGPRENERFDRTLPPGVNDNYRSNKPLDIIWGEDGRRGNPNPEDVPTLSSLGISAPPNGSSLFGLTNSLLAPLDPSLTSTFDLGLGNNNNGMGHNVSNVTTPIWGLEGTNNLLGGGNNKSQHPNDRAISPSGKGPGNL